MDIDEIIKSLEKLEATLICPRCNNLCQDPVRIMSCGEYFCENCINVNSHMCPSCKGTFFPQNLEHDNLARNSKINNKLHALKKTLKTEVKEITEPEVSNNEFKVDERVYHVNYVSSIGRLNAKGESSLHIACRKKNKDEVLRLLQQKVDINAKDYAGWAPIHEAVESKSVEIVEILLKNGALVNIPGEDYTTALHKAAGNDNVDMVSLLLKFGANKEAVDYSGLKALNLTCDNSIKEILLREFPQKINVTYELFVCEKIVAYCHSIDADAVSKLSSMKNVKIEKEFDTKKKITHFFIKKTHKMSFKILKAVLEGVQIVPQDMIDNFVSGEYFMPITEYTYIYHTELNRSMQKAMVNSLLKQPPLFHGINFYIDHHMKPINIYHLKVDKEFLTKLITSGGGHVLHRAPALRTCDKYFYPYHAQTNPNLCRCSNYIIYDESNPPKLTYNMAELLHRSSKWLIDCIINFKIS